jgi:hypothetical protein
MALNKAPLGGLWHYRAREDSYDAYRKVIDGLDFNSGIES